MRTLLLCVCCFIACGPPVPQPSEGDASTPALGFEPKTDAAHVSSVVHLHVARASSKELLLFEGTLSSYYVDRLQHGELPAALADRQQPLVSWLAQSGSERVAAPLQPLAVADYSLLSEAGLIGTFHVSSLVPVLRRVWPPRGGPGSFRFAVYCRDAKGFPALPDTIAATFEPSQVPVTLTAGADEMGSLADRCLHFSSDLGLADAELRVPPAPFGDFALDPAAFFGGVLEPTPALVCDAHEIAIGPGCASVADDRLAVRPPAATLLWTIFTQSGRLLEVTHAGTPLTVRGLSPETREHVWGSARDLSGARLSFDLVVKTAPARGRLILNEVLADALGPEPQSEWIELLNDGTLAVDLSEYALQDGGGTIALPEATLAPKEYALLVRRDFAENGSDTAPSPDARLLRVSSLGKSGLSNAGERLALLNSLRVECSVLPARAGKPGQSLARRTPSAPDDDPQSFSFGTPTPGFANDQPPSAAND